MNDRKKDTARVIKLYLTYFFKIKTQNKIFDNVPKLKLCFDNYIKFVFKNLKQAVCFFSIKYL